MEAETDNLSAAWENYLTAERTAAIAVLREVRSYVENDVLDGHPRYSKDFAVESSETKCHRGVRRTLLSRGKRAVKAPDGTVADLRHYCWAEIVFRNDEGTLEPVADVTFTPAHLDSSSGNRHAVLNVIAVEPPSDGFDHPEAIRYCGQLLSKTDEGTLAKLKEEIDRAIAKYCEDNNIDARSGRTMAQEAQD